MMIIRWGDQWKDHRLATDLVDLVVDLVDEQLRRESGGGASLRRQDQVGSYHDQDDGDGHDGHDGGDGHDGHDGGDGDDHNDHKMKTKNVQRLQPDLACS